MRTRALDIVTTGAALAVLSVLFAGCLGEDDRPLPEGATGALTVTVDAVEHKTVWPGPWAGSIGTYRVVLYSASGSEVGVWGPADPAVTPIAFEGLEYGTYDLTVEGFCADASPLCVVGGENLMIAVGALDGIVIGAPTVSVTVEVGPLLGAGFSQTGWVHLTLEWPVAEEVERVETEHMAIADDDWSSPWILTEFSTAGGWESVVIANEWVAANGSHVFRMRLYDGEGYLVSTAIEVVNVYGNFRTVGVVTLTSDDFTRMGEPDYSEWLEAMEDGQLQYVVTNWTPGAGDPTTLYFPGSYGLAGGPLWWAAGAGETRLDFSPPRTSLVIDDAVAGAIELKLCTAFPAESPWECWSFVGWTLLGVPSGYTPTRVDNWQVRIPSGAGDAVLVVLNVNMGTVTAYVRPAPAPDLGTLNVGLAVSDPAPAGGFELDCERVGTDVVCTHDGAFGAGASYKWYLNGVRLTDEGGESLTLPAVTLVPGYRVTLVVTEPPMAQSAQITLTPTMITGIVWTYVVGFEDATKVSYASATVTLTGLQWDLTEALIGTSASDFKNDAKSARLRGYGASSMTMLQDKPNGLGVITFQYRRYGAEGQVEWVVEYSTDAGGSWTRIGAPFTAPATDTVQVFWAEVNVAGNVRVRIKRSVEEGTVDRRLNIDDIQMSNFP
jgi:hypothetical protein